MLLEVRGLHVGYGGAPAVLDANLDIDVAQIVTVIGANGAGKSTLVNAIAGILRASRGTILIDGKDIARAPPHTVCEHGVAIVPEGRRLFTQMTVLENLELGSYRPGARAAGRQTLEEVFALFPILAERRHQIAGLMSGGQQQMVALGRALMARPRLVLMDEPSLGLSPAIVQDMFAAIGKINKRGVAVLLVEQNITKALELASYAYVLEQGQIVTSGPPHKLTYDHRIREAYLGI